MAFVRLPSQLSCHNFSFAPPPQAQNTELDACRSSGLIALKRNLDAADALPIGSRKLGFLLLYRCLTFPHHNPPARVGT
jgi:hypothetical protein